MVTLLDGKQVLIISVYSQSLLEHEEALRPEVLNYFLSRVVKELQLHSERLFKVLSERLPQFGADSWLDTNLLHLCAKVQLILH